MNRMGDQQMVVAESERNDKRSFDEEGVEGGGARPQTETEWGWQVGKD